MESNFSQIELIFKERAAKLAEDYIFKGFDRAFEAVGSDEIKVNDIPIFRNRERLLSFLNNEKTETNYKEILQNRCKKELDNLVYNFKNHGELPLEKEEQPKKEELKGFEKKDERPTLLELILQKKNEYLQAKEWAEAFLQTKYKGDSDKVLIEKKVLEIDLQIKAIDSIIRLVNSNLYKSVV